MTDVSITIPEVSMAAVARPGDMIVLAYPGPVDDAAIKKIKEAFQDRLPEIKVCILDNVGGMIVIKGAANDD